jgi:hypothetical protein
LELDEETLFGLMKMAHEQDITLNQLVENIVRAEIDRLENQRIAAELDELRRELDIDVRPKKSKKKSSAKD